MGRPDPGGPLRQPVQDVLAFVREATELAGAQRTDSRGTAIDALINQAREVFDFPRDGNALEQVLRSGTLATSLAPFAGYLTPLLSAIADPGSALGAAFAPVRDTVLQAVRALLPSQTHNVAGPLL